MTPLVAENTLLPGLSPCSSPNSTGTGFQTAQSVLCLPETRTPSCPCSQCSLQQSLTHLAGHTLLPGVPPLQARGKSMAVQDTGATRSLLTQELHTQRILQESRDSPELPKHHQHAAPSAPFMHPPKLPTQCWGKLPTLPPYPEGQRRKKLLGSVHASPKSTFTVTTPAAPHPVPFSHAEPKSDTEPQKTPQG